MFEKFKTRDTAAKHSFEAKQREMRNSEMGLERKIHKQAIEYVKYMANRQKGKEKKTLRKILSDNYHELIKTPELKKLVNDRFPHISYGQDVNSETFKKSFPPSYKRYFFKLVKNIVRTKNGKLEILRNPPSLTMTSGTRANTLADPIIKKSMNSRLNHFKVAKEIKNKYKEELEEYRLRVFKRQDIKDGIERHQKKEIQVFEKIVEVKPKKEEDDYTDEDENDQKDKTKTIPKYKVEKEFKSYKYNPLKEVFMTFEEIENCTFEPNCGKQNPHKYRGEGGGGGDDQKNFFDNMGDNFVNSNPKIYKEGILKKALLKLKNGNRDESFNIMFDAFNVPKICAKFATNEYNLWKEATG